MANTSSTVRKALNILNCFAERPDGLTLSHVVASTASVAPPVMDGGGKAIGSIVVLEPQSRFNHKRQVAALKLLLAACARIGEMVPAKVQFLEVQKTAKHRARVLATPWQRTELQSSAKRQMGT